MRNHPKLHFLAFALHFFFYLRFFSLALSLFEWGLLYRTILRTFYKRMERRYHVIDTKNQQIKINQFSCEYCMRATEHRKAKNSIHILMKFHGTWNFSLE